MEMDYSKYNIPSLIPPLSSKKSSSFEETATKNVEYEGWAVQ
jgi:hypothetical protein